MIVLFCLTGLLLSVVLAHMFGRMLAALSQDVPAMRSFDEYRNE
jgi:hypothetical protein